MTRQWLGVFVAAGFATTAVLGAQGNPSPRNTPPTDAASPPGIQKAEPAPSAQTKAGTVTMTGCIQDVPMTTAAAASAPGNPARAAADSNAAASAKTFYLNNTKMAADAGRDRPAVGTAGLAATGYRLDGDNSLITPHLNHQVQVVGMIQQSDVSPGSAAAGPTLKVESVTMVAAKCEPVK